MAASVVILPSPLLPATVYAGLTEALRGAGVEPLVLDPSPVLATGHRADPLVEHWAKGAEESDLLVAHSNAGLLAPVVRSRTDTPARIVFMDAALLPESGRSLLAPPSLRQALAPLADDRGILPPWTRWWAREALRTVIPEDLVEELHRGCPRLPMTYFDQAVQAPPEWASAANAYLAFGDTYAGELAFARDHSWPTDCIDGGHLHFLHEPAFVAERVLALAAELA